MDITKKEIKERIQGLEPLKRTCVWKDGDTCVNLYFVVFDRMREVLVIHRDGTFIGALVQFGDTALVYGEPGITSVPYFADGIWRKFWDGISYLDVCQDDDRKRYGDLAEALGLPWAREMEPGWVTVTFDRSEYKYLMDMVELAIHTELQPKLDLELGKKPRKRDPEKVSWLQSSLASCHAIKRRLLDAELE